MTKRRRREAKAERVTHLLQRINQVLIPLTKTPEEKVTKGKTVDARKARNQNPKGERDSSSKHHLQAVMFLKAAVRLTHN